jgi:hypothetical protein
MVLGLCLAMSPSAHGLGLPVLGDLLGGGGLPSLPVVGDLLGLLPDCVYKCPCSTTCLPKPGLAPLLDAHCIDAVVRTNLSCPSLSAQINVCCNLQASCYTSCHSQKTICDYVARLCLLTLNVNVALCDPKALDIDLDVLTSQIVLCDKYKDAQKYGCGCSD